MNLGPTKGHDYVRYLPSANEVWGKVIFSQALVCPLGGGEDLADRDSFGQRSTGQRPPWPETSPVR